MTARDRSEASLASQSDDLYRELKQGLGPPDECFGLRSRYQRDAAPDATCSVDTLSVKKRQRT